MRNFISSVALLLIISLIAVSCVPASLQDKTVKISFDAAENKTVDTDVYSIVGNVTWGSSYVEIGDVNDYYWSYTAVKNDDYYKTGETTTFVNCDEGTGLGGKREFSTGAWIFTLKAFSTAEARVTGETAVFEGFSEVSNLKADSSVAVPVDYTYDLGTGTANFTISTNVIQEVVEGITDTYEITKVEAVIRGVAVALTKTADGKWTGSTTVTSGKSPVYINVYLDDSTEPVTSEVGKAIIMNGMPTEITGSMVVSLTSTEDSTEEEPDTLITSAFYPVLPTEQPDESRFTDTEETSADDTEENELHYKVVDGHYEADDGFWFHRLNSYVWGTKLWLHQTVSLDGWEVITEEKKEILEAEEQQLMNLYEKIMPLQEEEYKSIVGQTINWGIYPASAPAEYAGKPISWLILDVDKENNRVLVISEMVLSEMKPYVNATLDNYTAYTYNWADCDINKYLNSDFVTEYSLENVPMASVSHETESYIFTDSNSVGTVGTATTSTEKVFLLSAAEAENYFADTAGRVADNLSETAVRWWLRSPGTSRFYCMAGVNCEGCVCKNGFLVYYDECGLRPAFWVDVI